MPAGPFTQAHVHPEGTSVVFWGGLDGKPQVWLYEFQSRTARQLTRPDIGSLEPSFDWEGRRVVFAADVLSVSSSQSSAQTEPWRRANMNLFVMNANGDNLRQITTGPFQDSRPAFSPDGKEVVFPRRVSTERVVRPWYSPDGKFIFFTAVSSIERPEPIRIWRISREGGEKEPITPEGLPNSQGVFADLDALHLWFHSTDFNTDAKTGPYRFNLKTREITK